MTWIILALLSAIALASAELMQQHLLYREKVFSERASAVLTFATQSFIAIPIIFLFGLGNQFLSIFTFPIFSKVILVSIGSAIAMILYLRSFKVKNISISTIFVSMSVVVSTILGIIFFNESISYLKFIGIILILAAIIIVKYDNVILEKNHLYGLGAGLIFGFLYVLDKSIILEIHPLIYIFWSFLMISIWGFIFGGRDVIKSIKCARLIAYKPIVISAVAYFLFNVFTFMAYRSDGEVGRIDAINPHIPRVLTRGQQLACGIS